MNHHFLQFPPDKKIQNYLFSFKAKLGKGAYGTVYLGKHEKSGQVVALKVIDKKILSTEYAQQLINQEIEIMKKIDNENIVKLIDVLHSINNTYIITEYCNGGDLREFLKKKKCLPEEEALKIFKNILQGLKDLICVGIIHRDIKPANILINDGAFKLTDFGFAREVTNHQDTIMNSLVGTPLYMSPQILKRQSYTSKCDVWSLGLILYEMIYGVTPWHSQNLVELMQRLDSRPLQFPPAPKISDPLRDLIKQCLQLREDRRISWDALFQHPLVNIAAKIEVQPLPLEQIPAVINNTSTLIQHQSSRPSMDPQISKQRSNSNMQIYFPNKYNEYYNTRTRTETLQRVSTDHSRERSHSTLDKLKIFEPQHTPPLGKHYNSSKNNNDSTPSALNSNSTTTTISSGRPRIKVNQFEVNFKSKANQTMEFQHEKKHSIFQEIKISDSRLKRTNSLNTRLSNAPQTLSSTKQLQQYVRVIHNQLDLIPNHIELKRDIQAFSDHLKSRLQRELTFNKEDSARVKALIQQLVAFLDYNKNDHFVVQVQVVLLLLSCLAGIVSSNVQLSGIMLNSLHQEQIKKVYEIQQGQLAIPQAEIQQQIVKYLELIH